MNAPPDSDRPETPANPAANARKHGFCAARILAPETLARAKAIEAELNRIHEPWSPEETQAIAQCSLARAQQYDVELAMSRKVADEKLRAAELYERNAQARFLTDLARFQENPALNAHLLGMTWHGAAWFENLWSRLAAELASDPTGSPACLPFTLACEAATALGAPWRVDLVNPEAAWLMARYVRISPDPEAALELWIDRSNAPDGPAFSRIRARRLLAQAPADPAIAAAELAARATAERDRWSLQARQLRANDETARDSAAETAVGTGLGDPALEREFRLLSRYLTSARNRADRLQRRIDTLKKERKSLAYKLQRDAEREARRLKKESEKAARRFETESDRIRRERAAFHSVPVAPACEDDDAATRDDFDDAFVDRFEAKPVDTFDVDPAHVMAQAIEPGRSAVSQTTRAQRDRVELRNEPRAFDDDEIDAGQRFEDEPDPEFASGEVPAHDSEPAAGIPAWMDRNAPLRDRVRMMRYRNWGDPTEVFDDEVNLLKQCVAIPESFERQVAVQAFFGSEKVLRRCWKAYCAWASPDGAGRASAV